MKNLELKIPPPILVLVTGLLMWLGDFLSPNSGGSIFNTGIGLAIGVVGIGIIVTAARSFRKVQTTISPIKPENASVLVDTGIFCLSRNPMYVGMALMLIGWAVWLGNTLTIFGPILFVIYITRFQILPEESVMNELFGDEYRAYTSRVRRWI